MDAATTISLLISITSLLAAAYIGIRQYTIQKSANSVPANFEILAQIQRPEFHSSFQFIVEELNGYDSNQGLAGLPLEARTKVYHVCYFFQHVAMLMVLDLIDEKLFTAYFRARTVAVWENARPFIEKERAINPATGPEFLTLFEAFAIKAARIEPEVGQGILARWLARNNHKWESSLLATIGGRQRVWVRAYSDAMGRPIKSASSRAEQASAGNPDLKAK